MDVTPRPGLDPARGQVAERHRSKGLLVGVVLVAVLAAVGFLLVKQVGEASLYYYNADEAVAKKAELGDDRFRIQGTYVGTKQVIGADAIRFDVAFGGTTVSVEHSGSEPALFKPGIPVLCEGRWSPDRSVFLSDRIAVKHSESYKAENPGRVDPAAP